MTECPPGQRTPKQPHSHLTLVTFWFTHVYFLMNMQNMSDINAKPPLNTAVNVRHATPRSKTQPHLISPPPSTTNADLPTFRGVDSAPAPPNAGKRGMARKFPGARHAVTNASYHNYSPRISRITQCMYYTTRFEARIAEIKAYLRTFVAVTPKTALPTRTTG